MHIIAKVLTEKVLFGMTITLQPRQACYFAGKKIRMPVATEKSFRIVLLS